MTQNPMIDGNDCNPPIEADPATPSGIRSRWNGAAANKYLRLAAFGVVWTVLNMVLVNCAFEASFRPPPYQMVKIFAPPS